MARSFSNKIKFASAGALLVPSFAHLALYTTKHDYIFYMYFVLFLIGGFSGFLTGRMKDRRLRQKPKSKGEQQQSSDHKIVSRQDTNNAPVLYIGNNKSHTVHLPECRTIKKLTSCNKIIFASRQRAISLAYVPCNVCKP
jgi:hypothetical protein